MKVTMNNSCSTQKDFIVQRPINGKTKLVENQIKPGVWTRTVATAEVDCDGDGSGITPGQTCTQYGPESGEGIVVQRTLAADGGANGAPYSQEILTITGATN